MLVGLVIAQGRFGTVRFVRGLSPGACAVGYMRGALSVVSKTCDNVIPVADLARTTLM
jgi:hypothetical protein